MYILIITDKRATEIQEALFEHGLDTEEFRTFVIRRSRRLYGLACLDKTIDDVRREKKEPALIVINKE